MKVLFNCHWPYSLSHGGMQVNIERSKTALHELGVDVQYLEWWNDAQKGDILHQFGYLPLPLVKLAQERGLKVAMTILLTETCNRSRWELLVRKVCIRSALALPAPRRLKESLNWRAYRQADVMIVGLETERQILEDAYGIEKELISVVPSGLNEVFLKAAKAVRSEDHLICQGRIGPTKNCVELARLAHAAKVPILFVGKPADSRGAYWQQFSDLIDNKYVKHDANVATEGGLVESLRRARGYVLMSRYENWCLAAHEAAACGLPLLLPDQRWSRERFGDEASYFPKAGGDAGITALRRFYEQSLELPAPRARLFSWREVGEMLRDTYARLLNGTPS